MSTQLSPCHLTKARGLMIRRLMREPDRICLQTIDGMLGMAAAFLRDALHAAQARGDTETSAAIEAIIAEHAWKWSALQTLASVKTVPESADEARKYIYRGR